MKKKKGNTTQQQQQTKMQQQFQNMSYGQTTNFPNKSSSSTNIGDDDDENDDECLLISPWSIFVELYKPIFTNMFPNESKMEIYRHLRNKWKQFDDSDKKAYIEKAHNKNRAVIRLNNIETKKKMPQNDRKTVSPYSLFVEAKHQELKKGNPELSLIERSELISQMWRQLSPNEKRPFMNLAKRKTRYLQKHSSSESEFFDD